jgi:Na+/proline symporter
LSTATIIFIGVGFYIVLMVAIGVYASGKTHTVNEFIVAGRGLPVWLCSTTIVATWFGGGTMMGASGAAYDNGMLGVIADPLGAALALFLFGFFFARLFRRLRILTVADYMAQRYGQVAAMAITAKPYFFQTSPGSAQCSSPSVSFSRP